jgi:HD domain
MQVLEQQIQQSHWWQKACSCPDRHYHATHGIMLTDHLLAVTHLVEQIFTNQSNHFLQEMFLLIEALGLDKRKIRDELVLVALLHDIGKTEDDKSQYVVHPLTKQIVINRHSVVGVKAAKEILDDSPLLSLAEKKRIYWIVEQHDISYGLFREFKKDGLEPDYATWQIINNNIHPVPGAGLLYLLIFKLADIHGHANIEDVIWFYKTVFQHYFKAECIRLPIPKETDIRERQTHEYV